MKRTVLLERAAHSASQRRSQQDRVGPFRGEPARPWLVSSGGIRTGADPSFQAKPVPRFPAFIRRASESSDRRVRDDSGQVGCQVPLCHVAVMPLAEEQATRLRTSTELRHPRAIRTTPCRGFSCGADYGPFEWQLGKWQTTSRGRASWNKPMATQSSTWPSSTRTTEVLASGLGKPMLLVGHG
jgi:hypothetical protein